ncbi:DUF1571 domain-containing protein [Novipirellula herctigrandis]
MSSHKAQTRMPPVKGRANTLPLGEYTAIGQKYTAIGQKYTAIGQIRSAQTGVNHPHPFLGALIRRKLDQPKIPVVSHLCDSDMGRTEQIWKLFMTIPRRQFCALLGSIAATGSSIPLFAEDREFAEPVHRVANATSVTPKQMTHPLDRALEMARDGLESCRKQIDDYTAILVKRERVGSSLGGHEFMFAKVRNRKVHNGQIVQPLSVYLNFLKPSSVKGREVIFVENQNDGNIIAHEGGFKGKFLPTVSIPPDGMLAMRGQRYPMTEIGVENLIVKLIERGEQAKHTPGVKCEFRKNAKIKGRTCTVLHVTQPIKTPQGAEFHQAEVFMDDVVNVPIRYVAYDWPQKPGGPLNVLEEYTYLDIKVNVGLTDADFNPHNDEYNFYSK